VDGPLAGRRALVTGGAAGIGGAIAVALARAGADVGLTYLTHDPAKVVAQIEEAGRRAAPRQLDARRSWEVDDAVAAVADELGGLDVLVNNAGGLVQRRAFAATDDASLHQVLDVNLSSAMYATRSALRFLPDGGRIVSVGAQAGRGGGGTGSVVYATAKAALEGFTRALARELGPRGITVNVVAPGFVAGTPMHAQHTPDPAQRAAVAATALGAPGTPEDVAAAVVYLASPGARYVTGTVLDVNGGARFS